MTYIIFANKTLRKKFLEGGRVWVKRDPTPHTFFLSLKREKRPGLKLNLTNFSMEDKEGGVKEDGERGKEATKQNNMFFSRRQYMFVKLRRNRIPFTVTNGCVTD